jgi:hypothetical protein
MRLEQDSNLLPNSAAIPLPTPPDSAAGRHAKIIPKLLSYNKFLGSQGHYSDADARFFPAVREWMR